MYWGTTDRQRSLASTLADLPDAAVREGFTNPSIIVVGDVVRLKDKLDWFEKKPLFGRTVVVTRGARAGQRQRRASGGKRRARHSVPHHQDRAMPDYAELDEAVSHLSRYGWVVFTSVNGVRFFRQRLSALNLDARALGSVKVAAIGPATAKAVEEMGIRPDSSPPPTWRKAWRRPCSNSA